MQKRLELEEDNINIEAKSNAANTEGKGKNSCEREKKVSLTSCVIMQVVVGVSIDQVSFPNVNKAIIH